MTVRPDRLTESSSPSTAEEQNPDLCLVGLSSAPPESEQPRSLVTGDVIVRALSPRGEIVDGGYWGRGTRKDMGDGTTLTSYSAFGVSILRDQRNRITSATTRYGQTVNFEYRSGEDNPYRCTYLGVTYGQEGGELRLDQQTGEFSYRFPDNRSAVHDLHGESREVAFAGNVTTTTRFAGGESRVTVDANGNELFRTDVQNGAWTAVENFTAPLSDGRTQTDMLVSRYNPQGEQTQIPGLTREQINGLRQARGLNPLAANELPIWNDNITYRVSNSGTHPEYGMVLYEHYATASGESYNAILIPAMVAGQRRWFPVVARSPLDSTESEAKVQPMRPVPGNGNFPAARHLPCLPTPNWFTVGPVK